MVKAATMATDLAEFEKTKGERLRAGRGKREGGMCYKGRWSSECYWVSHGERWESASTDAQPRICNCTRMRDRVLRMSVCVCAMSLCVD